MADHEVATRGRSLSIGAISALAQTLVGLPKDPTCRDAKESPHPIVYIVDIDDNVRRSLSGWLKARGIDVKAYSNMGAFQAAYCTKRPGCLIIDAQPLAVGEFGSTAEPISVAPRCPIIVTSCRADVATAVEAMKSGAFDFMEKPFREDEMISVISAAVELDRKWRDVATHHGGLLQRFTTLSQRERQVMALVTIGKLNKQVGACLGLS